MKIVLPLIASKRTTIAVAATLLAALAALLVWGTQAAQSQTTGTQTTYTIKDLGTTDGQNNSSALDVNSSGQVAGVSWYDPEGVSVIITHGFLYANESMTDIGNLRGGSAISESGAYALNNNSSPLVVGSAEAAADNETHPVLYDSSNNTLTDLGLLSSDQIQPYGQGWATGVNDSGQVVGTSTTDDGGVHAFLWQGGSMTDLGTLGGLVSEAVDISEAGRVAVSSNLANGATRGFVYDNDTVREIEPLPGGSFSVPYAISSSDQVVGIGDASDGSHHVFIYDYLNNTMSDIGAEPGYDFQPTGINSSGQVVGHAPDDDYAYFYKDGSWTDLNTLLPSNSGWTELAARSINDKGQIVGQGSINGQTHAFLMTPQGAEEATPPEQIREVQLSIDTIINQSNLDPNLAEEFVVAKASLEDAVTALGSGDRQTALEYIEQAMSDIQPAVETAVENGSLSDTQGNQIMAHLAEVARQIALDAVDEAEAREEANQTFVDEARAAITQGDVLRDSREFTKAVDMYKDALVKAEAA